MNPRFARNGLLALAGLCATISLSFYILGPLWPLLWASLGLYPAGLAVLWYALEAWPQSKYYGVAAAVATCAALMLPLSLGVGPLFPTIAGLTVVAFFEKDLLLFFAALASVVAILVADGEYFLWLAASGVSNGLPGEISYGVLAGLLAIATLTSALRPRISKTAPPSIRPTGHYEI